MKTSPSTLSETHRLGTVIELDLTEALARVEIGDLESDWIPFASACAGETKSWLPPSIGEQVVVTCPDGDLEGGYIGASLYSDANPAPSDKPGGLLKFSDGAVLSYDPETHALDVTLPAGGEITLTGPEHVTINAASGATINAAAGLTINGDVTLNGTLTSNQDVIASGKSLKTHKHSGVQAGAAQSGGPV
jgi:phage baseplate assembly protein V